MYKKQRGRFLSNNLAGGGNGGGGVCACVHVFMCVCGR